MYKALSLGSPGGSGMKSPPTKAQKTQVRSLGWEDPLKQEMATFSSILAWRILWTKKPGWATVHGIAELDMTESSHMLVK